MSHDEINDFLKEFLQSSNSITVTLRNYLQSKNRILLNMISFSDAFVGEGNMEIALEKAENYPFESEDPNIAIIYYCLWSLISLKSKRIREAKFLIDLAKAKAKEKENVYIEVLTYLKQMEAEMYFGFDELKSTLLHCIEITPRNSPSQKKLRLHYAFTLARQGIAKSYIEKLIKEKEFETKNSDLHHAFQFVRFLDHTEAGRFNDAMALLPEVDLHHESLVDQAYLEFGLYYTQRILLNIYHVVLFSNQKEQLSLNLTPTSFLTKDEDQLYYPTWILIIECLLENKKQDALIWARTNEDIQNGLTQSQNFTSFNLIRAELASSNIENAKRILFQRHKNGNHHYFDNFYLARISLLEENLDDAHCYFSKFMEDVELNESWGRLDLELRLAKELNPLRILKIGMNLSKNKQTEVAKVTETNSSSSGLTGINRILGESLSAQEIREKVKSYAKLDLPVLITGETGTGKEVVAKALYEESLRNKSPFITVNCAAISDTILESELFGHQKGSFTGATHNRKGLFEEAKNGTIFLDEIGDISPRLQIALLRVLETGEIRPVGSNKNIQINCRAIAATNAPLEELTTTGRFRKDLLFRLQRLNFWLPPLRDRKIDIMQLSESYISSIKRSNQKLSFSDEFVAAMEEYPWPGNIRELKNEIEFMALMNPGKTNFTLNDLDLKIRVYLEKISKNKTWENPEYYTTEINEIKTSKLNMVKTENASKEIKPAQNTTINMDELISKSTSPLRRIQKLKILFEKHIDLTRKEICQHLEVSPQTTSKDLKQLIKDNFIVKIEPSAAPRTHYFSKILTK
ncbi:MAG: hypothetical protein COA79_00340 [Planctomycetota bacterium]|nr:MAG: hypothetical protein COA79_00340 [Planctomycetota bacterium]